MSDPAKRKEHLLELVSKLEDEIENIDGDDWFGDDLSAAASLIHDQAMNNEVPEQHREAMRELFFDVHADTARDLLDWVIASSAGSGQEACLAAVVQFFEEIADPIVAESGKDPARGTMPQSIIANLLWRIGWRSGTETASAKTQALLVDDLLRDLNNELDASLDSADWYDGRNHEDLAQEVVDRLYEIEGNVSKLLPPDPAND